MYKKIFLVFLLSGSIFLIHGMEEVRSLLDLSKAVVVKQVINESVRERLLDECHEPFYFAVPEKKAEKLMQKLAFLPDELRIPILKEIGRTLRLKYRKVLNLGVDYGFSIKDLSSSVEHINHFLVKCSSYNLKEHEMFLDNLGINSLEGIESLHTGIEYSKNKPKSMICNIEKVKHLYVTKNSISKLENYLFLNFSTLKSLHLADNKIRMIKPDSLSGLGNLEYLSLANNELTNFDPRILQHTPNLQGINLCSNYLKNTQELEEAIKKEFPQDYGIHIYLDSQKECPKEEKKK